MIQLLKFRKISHLPLWLFGFWY